ncbi:MAG: ABC transporter substrate-binding protein [Reyranella sp.]|uniref:ABC transporter substrate-binding protein n=1 Tax=Reyranella sp. TaxID=1929291 RepID=UPI003D0B6367
MAVQDDIAGSFATAPDNGMGRRRLLALAALGLATAPNVAWSGPPQGQLTWAVHFSLAPTWFDPAETPAMITPFLLMYALHDAVVKPMPGSAAAPCLAEAWKASPDGLAYQFTLRAGAKFHNGEPVTPEDVKFSFERYRGTAATLMKERVAAIETPDARTVRFVLKKPWPDFLTFYSSATGAGWIVPKKYVEQVGEDGFKKAPVGAGPYRFVSFTPGVELVLEAFDGYWRKPPAVKRLVFKVVPEEATRLAALKRGEVDLAYSIRGELAEELKRTPGLTLKPVVIQGTFWLYFPDQWDAKSPWHDQRVRDAARFAIDYKSISEALTLGHSPITNNIIPDGFDYYWKAPAAVYDAAKAKKLLADAGLRSGFDAGDYYCDASYANLGEAVINSLQEVGIRVKLRPLERAAFFKSYSEKKLKNIIQGSSGAFGNAATRLETFAVKGGAYSYGSYPEIDTLFAEQAIELDQTKRTEKLHRIQQIIHERSVYAPIWQLAFLNGQGKRVGESGLGLVRGHAYSAPYEDVTIKQT